LIEAALARWNEKPSAVKTAVGGITGAMQSVMTEPFQDELVKNALADFAAENFEIACYQALIVAAETLGDADTEQMCEAILEDEEDMAAWLEENLPMTVQETLALQQAESRT
jgi:ferritin-like metal-binding protein YciE